MVLKEIVGSAVTVFMIIYCLYFLIPATKTAYNSELSVVNQSSTQLAIVIPIFNPRRNRNFSKFFRKSPPGI